MSTTGGKPRSDCGLLMSSVFSASEVSGDSHVEKLNKSNEEGECICIFFVLCGSPNSHIMKELIYHLELIIRKHCVSRLLQPVAFQ